MHKLLERQLRRAFGDKVPAGLEDFMATVDATYRGHDDDRELLERAMELTSQELLARNDDLRQKQLEQQVIFDSVPAMIFYKDTENRILRLNETAARALGRPLADLEGADTYDLFPPEVAKALHDDDLAVIRSGKPKLGVVECHPGADGKLLWLRTDKVPYRDAAGRARGVIVLSVDITESRMAQEAVRASEERYRQIVETATEGIWSLDRDGRTLFANQVMARMLGVNRDELMGRNVLEFVHPGDRSQALASLDRLVHEGRTLRMDFRFRRADGATLWVHCSGAPTLDGEGQVQGMLGMMSDITDRRRAEDELRGAYARLQEVDRAKSQFLNTAAHELGTPLTPMALQVRVVRDRFASTMTGDQRRSLDILDRSVVRLTSLVRDLLDAARLQTDHLRLARDPIDASAVVRQSVQAFTDMAAHAGIVVSTDLFGPLPVRADARRLGQVFDNLLANAIKFTRRGGWVALRSRARDDAAEIEVEDNGIGMPPEAIPKLFKPFSQVHDTMQVNEPGTGLGLYICKGIVELSGGTIDVVSPGLGKGTTFKVRIPLAIGVPAPLGRSSATGTRTLETPRGLPTT